MSWYDKIHSIWELPGSGGVYNTPLDDAIKRLGDYITEHNPKDYSRHYSPGISRMISILEEAFLGEPWYARHADHTIGFNRTCYYTHEILAQTFGWWFEMLHNVGSWEQNERDFMEQVFPKRDYRTVMTLNAEGTLAEMLMSDWNEFGLITAQMSRLEESVNLIDSTDLSQLRGKIEHFKQAFLELPWHERHADPMASGTLRATHRVLTKMFRNRFTFPSTSGQRENEPRKTELRKTFPNRHIEEINTSSNDQLANFLVEDWNGCHLEVQLQLLEDYVRVAIRGASDDLPFRPHFPKLRHILPRLMEGFLKLPQHERYPNLRTSMALDHTGHTTLGHKGLTALGHMCKVLSFMFERLYKMPTKYKTRIDKDLLEINKDLLNIFPISRLGEEILGSDANHLTDMLVEHWNNSHLEAKIDLLYRYIKARPPDKALYIPYQTHGPELLRVLESVENVFVKLPRHERQLQYITDGTKWTYKKSQALDYTTKVLHAFFEWWYEMLDKHNSWGINRLVLLETLFPNRTPTSLPKVPFESARAGPYIHDLTRNLVEDWNRKRDQPHIHNNDGHHRRPHA